MQCKISFFTILAAIGLAMVCGTLLEAGEKYKVLNGDVALTADDERQGANLTVRAYNGSTGQQWKFDKAFGSEMYVIRSAFNQNLILDVEENEFGFFARLFSFGNKRHWRVTEMGDNHYELRNKRFGLCLKNFGSDEPVDISQCNNSTETRWSLVKLENTTRS